jgi:hypothetical protein
MLHQQGVDSAIRWRGGIVPDFSSSFPLFTLTAAKCGGIVYCAKRKKLPL